MIDYVDRLLVHWAQEFSVRDGGISLGYTPGWLGGPMAEASGDLDRYVSARGVASRPTKARSGVGKVAERVNQSVESLEEHLQKSIRIHYLENSGLLAKDKAEKLGVSLSTYHRYLHRAHEAISADLPDTYVHWELRKSAGLIKKIL